MPKNSLRPESAPLNGFLITECLLTPTKIRYYSKKQTIKPEELLVGSDVVEIASSVKLLGIHIVDQLNFNLHVSNICESASKKLPRNGFAKLKCFLGFNE